MELRRGQDQPHQTSERESRNMHQTFNMYVHKSKLHLTLSGVLDWYMTMVASEWFGITTPLTSSDLEVAELKSTRSGY